MMTLEQLHAEVRKLAGGRSFKTDRTFWDHAGQDGTRECWSASILTRDSKAVIAAAYLQGSPEAVLNTLRRELAANPEPVTRDELVDVQP